jgi:hypothetical protein
MRQIKIIKKNEIFEEIKPRQTIDVNFSNSRLDEGVKRWVADWRTRKEIEKQRALSELSQLKKKDVVVS